MQERFAKLILDISHHKVDKLFTYIIPKELEDEIEVGQVVEVDFGNSKISRKAYVVEISDDTDIEYSKLRYIKEISKTQRIADVKLVKLALWISKFYGCTMARAISTVLPVKKKVAAVLDSYVYRNFLVSDIDKLTVILRKKRRTSWLRLIEALKDNESLSFEYVKKVLKISPVNTTKMQDEGYIRIESTRLYRNPEFIQKKDKQNIELNKEQSYIVDNFKKDIKENERNYLLFGITGSGKTVVYIELIKYILSIGRQVIFLVPEIGLSYQVIRQLSAVFGDRLAIINSSLSYGERHDQFQKVTDKKADIMIGPRTALFTPFDNIGLIIIDEEHDGAYKNENMPRYDARRVALEIATLHNASLVLGSATPSIESYTLALQGKYKLFKLTKRAGEGSNIADTHIVDLREELKRGNKSIFSVKLTQLILDRLKKKEQIILFINRRGYSNFVSCRSCGDAIKCVHCDVSMTLHKDNILRCHYCGYSIALPKNCPSCNSRFLAGFGIGTQRLESMTAKMFPSARILRLDTDNAHKKNNTDKILSSFENGEYDILIGTQMIVKGHDFSKVTLVGIMAADISLYTSSYTASERTFALLTQAAGRAGRRDMHSDVVIQSYKPEHYAIKAAATQDYESFYEAEISYRKMLLYPPAIHILSIQFAALSEDKLLDFEKKFMSRLHEAVKGYKALITGPVSPSVYKLYDYYRKILYIKHYQYDILNEIKIITDGIADEINTSLDIAILYDFT